jgi:hypothetical protein
MMEDDSLTALRTGYAFVDAQSLGLGTQPEAFAELAAKETAIKRAVMSQRTILHPFEIDPADPFKNGFILR